MAAVVASATTATTPATAVTPAAATEAKVYNQSDCASAYPIMMMNDE